MGVFSFSIRWNARKTSSLSQDHGIFKHHKFWFLVTRFPRIKRGQQLDVQGFKRPTQWYHSNHIRIRVLEVFINFWKGEFNDTNTDPWQRSLCAWVNAPRWITAFFPFRSNPCALLMKLASSGWMMDSYEQLLVGRSLSSTTQRFFPTTRNVVRHSIFINMEKPWRKHEQATRVRQQTDHQPAPWAASQLKQLKAQQENLGSREQKCHPCTTSNSEVYEGWFT